MSQGRAEGGAQAARPPRLLHVFPTFDVGGAQMRAVELMTMAPADWQHDVLAMNGQFGACDLLPADRSVERLQAPDAGGFLGMAKAMAKLHRQRQPNLLLTYNWGAIESVLAARLSKTTLVHHEDGFGPEESERPLRRRVWMRRLLLRGAAAVVVPSQTLQRMAEQQWRVSKRRLCYLPNGVDLQRFQPAATAASAPVLGHVGQLRGEKNQRLLLRAFAACGVADARLRIFGKGGEEAGLRALARELGVAGRVEFCGVVADTGPVYREMQAFVLSSDTEQMPLTVLEAMASGLPVLSTDVGDVRNMVAAEGHALITPKGDVDALAASMARILTDTELREACGVANRAVCEQRFEKGACYGAYVDLYAELLSGVAR